MKVICVKGSKTKLVTVGKEYTVYDETDSLYQIKIDMGVKAWVSKSLFKKKDERVKLKHIIVINGSGGVGKDTFVELCGKYAKVHNVSTIDMVNEASLLLGCDSAKTERNRAFKSDLKLLADKYYGHSLAYITDQINEFLLHSNDEVLFIHCREPENIKAIVDMCDAITIIVKNKNVPNIISNMADANVENYTYDYTIQNYGSIDDLDSVAESFIKHLNEPKITIEEFCDSEEKKSFVDETFDKHAELKQIIKDLDNAISELERVFFSKGEQ